VTRQIEGEWPDSAESASGSVRHAFVAATHADQASYIRIRVECTVISRGVSAASWVARDVTWLTNSESKQT
jgi:hypothetical protein